MKLFEEYRRKKIATEKLLNQAKSKTKHEQRELEEQAQHLTSKAAEPIGVEDLLKDKFISEALPTIRRLLKIYLLLPQSEAVVERGFSKMKLIMTKRRTALDSLNLDALMRLSYQQEKFHDSEIETIMYIWKHKKFRRVFNL